MKFKKSIYAESFVPNRLVFLDKPGQNPESMAQKPENKESKEELKVQSENLVKNLESTLNSSPELNRIFSYDMERINKDISTGSYSKAIEKLEKTLESVMSYPKNTEHLEKYKLEGKESVRSTGDIAMQMAWATGLDFQAPGGRSIYMKINGEYKQLYTSDRAFGIDLTIEEELLPYNTPKFTVKNGEGKVLVSFTFERNESPIVHAYNMYETMQDPEAQKEDHLIMTDYDGNLEYGVKYDDGQSYAVLDIENRKF